MFRRLIKRVYRQFVSRFFLDSNTAAKYNSGTEMTMASSASLFFIPCFCSSSTEVNALQAEEKSPLIPDLNSITLLRTVEIVYRGTWRQFSRARLRDIIRKPLWNLIYTNMALNILIGHFSQNHAANLGTGFILLVSDILKRMCSNRIGLIQ